MRRVLVGIVAALTLFSGVVGPAAAQSGSSKATLGGTILDADGGAIPGVTVDVKNTESGVTLTTVTNGEGQFQVPALDVGTYVVTATLSGFKTAVLTGVKLVSGSPASVRITLAIGNVEETVVVRANTELVQTQSSTVASTFTSEQVKALPQVSRSVVYSVTLLPGVDTAAGTGSSPRNSTISGLPGNALNVTLDGVSVRDNAATNGALFSMIQPQADAIEQVTMTSAAAGADSAGQGSVTIRFVTRSGTDKYKGTFYYYLRHPDFNTNYYFNELNGLPKNQVKVGQFGGSVGGPLIIPGLLKRGKGFFFFNFEEFRQPTEVTRTRTMLSAQAQAGQFQYVSGGQTRQVDLLALATANGQTNTMDPTVRSLLAEVQAAAQKRGTISASSDPNTNRYVFLNPADFYNHLPTTRLDFNLTNRHRLTGTWYWQSINRTPETTLNDDPTFPELPNYGDFRTHRQTASMALRSALSSTLVNELVAGVTSTPTNFNRNASAEQFVNQGGYSLTFPLLATPATVTGTLTQNEYRHTPIFNIDDTLSVLRGNHSITIGAGFTQIYEINNRRNPVSTITFDVQAGADPADAMFTAANFPGAQSTDLANARALYAFLTGRVSAINATGALDDETGKYIYNGEVDQRLRMTETSVYVQDQWRVARGLTLNGGLRYQLQLPAVATIPGYSYATFADLCGVSGTGTGIEGRGCNLFMPGTLTGSRTQFTALEPGEKLYKTDWNNLAPNVGAAWRPMAQSGFWRKLLGDPEQATIRAGYSIAYNRVVMGTFRTNLLQNPGRTTNANRNAANGNLVYPGQQWPLLYRETARLGPPAECTGTVTAACMATTPVYPIAGTIATNLRIYDPDLQLDYSRQFSAGFQRQLSSDMAVELRYVRTRNIGTWATENWNEINTIENGFLNEFKVAQANLYANIGAGRGQTFAYMGPGTGTSPLPIFAAHFNAVPAAQAGDASRYTGTSWTNSTFTGFLSRLNPSVLGFASTNTSTGLYGNTTFRNNGVAAGLPVNFWALNPNVGLADIVTNGPGTEYDALQIDLRRRMSRGLLFTANYTVASSKVKVLDTIRESYTLERALTGVPQAFKLTSVWDVPFGRERRFGADAPGWLESARRRMDGQRCGAGPDGCAAGAERRAPGRHVGG